MTGSGQRGAVKFIRGLFENAVNRSDFIASNDRMIGE
jgi:hypothetical protein